jgi:hypothetical protein
MLLLFLLAPIWGHYFLGSFSFLEYVLVLELFTMKKLVRAWIWSCGFKSNTMPFVCTWNSWKVQQCERLNIIVSFVNWLICCKICVEYYKCCWFWNNGYKADLGGVWHKMIGWKWKPMLYVITICALQQTCYVFV